MVRARVVRLGDCQSGSLQELVDILRHRRLSVVVKGTPEAEACGQEPIIQVESHYDANEVGRYFWFIIDLLLAYRHGQGRLRGWLLDLSLLHTLILLLPIIWNALIFHFKKDAQNLLFILAML